MACEENQWVLFNIAGPVAEVSLKTFGNERVMGPKSWLQAQSTAPK
jgi:hypothetical protein